MRDHVTHEARWVLCARSAGSMIAYTEITSAQYFRMALWAQEIRGRPTKTAQHHVANEPRSLAKQSVTGLR